VHILGISHGSPQNPALLHALTMAVRPDVIAVEQPAHLLPVLHAVAESLTPQLKRLCTAPLEQQLWEAHSMLVHEERMLWCELGSKQQQAWHKLGKDSLPLHAWSHGTKYERMKHVTCAAGRIILHV
jgi:hypothetical protein